MHTIYEDSDAEHNAKERLDAILRPMARRVNFAVWLNHAIGPVIALLGGWATLLLFFKLVWPTLAFWSLLLPAALPVCLAGSFAWCRRRGYFFKHSELAEVVDHLYRDDGSISSVYEKPTLAGKGSFYQDVAREMKARRPSLQPRYYARRLAPVLVYAAICILVPPRQSAAAVQHREIVQTMTAPLEAKLTEFAPILPEEKVEELKAQLEQMQKNEDEVSREKWESVEELERKIDEAVESTQFDLAPVVTSMQALSKAGSSLQSSGPGGAQQQQQLMQQLEASLNDPNKKLSTQLRGDLSKMASQLKGGDLNREALDRQLQNLREKMNCSGNCKPGTCPAGMCNKPGENPGDKPGNAPGKGGISRGRGDAPLTFGEENRLDNAKFEQKELLNKYLASEDMVDLGITPLAPKADPGQFHGGGAVQVGEQQGPPVSRSRISPSQRKVVQQYFSETK